MSDENSLNDNYFNEEDYDSIGSNESGLQAGLTYIMTIDEMLDLGLKIFYKESRIKRSCAETNERRFISHYGSSSIICTIVWEDLQTTTIQDAQVQGNMLNPKYYLMALNHLKRYPTELQREGPWDISGKTGREWVWFYCEKIQSLKHQKIIWPADNFGDDIWAISVDGTHCWMEEPQHKEWSQDPSYYSHKYNKAGMNYEIGISLSECRVVWLNGPFKAGANDVKIFARYGLKQKLQQTYKKAIGDKGYVGHPEEVSTYNIHDNRSVNNFKSRALKRHETFNGLTKRFDCLNHRFRHTPYRFKTCFEAVCVLCQYQIENGSELFDALVEDVLRESDDELDDDESDDESDDEYDDETDLRIAF